MKLPKELTTVTPLSKYLAMVVFISLPFVGFFLGMRYQEMVDLAERQQMEKNLSITRAPTPTPSIFVLPTVDPLITTNWKTYTNTIDNFTLKYPQSWSVRTLNNQIIFATTDRPGGRIELTVNNENDSKLEPFKKLQNTTYNPLATKEIMINSLKVNEVHHISCITNNDCITVVVKTGGKIFALSPWVESERYNDLKIIYQILSTFKFTN